MNSAISSNLQDNAVQSLSRVFVSMFSFARSRRTGFAVYATLFAQLIGGYTTFVHHFPQLVKYDHANTPKIDHQ